jgi:8-oxo-dGTP pyrophosphatase MutT (NUDIX family)
MRDYACAIFVRNGRLLLGRRAPHRRAYADKWDVLGGLVEDGESIEEALVRELGEEVGVVPTVWETLCGVLDDSPEARGVAFYHMFVVRSWAGGEPTMANDEHSVLKWFTVEEACALGDLALEDYRTVFRKICF